MWRRTEVHWRLVLKQIDVMDYMRLGWFTVQIITVQCRNLSSFYFHNNQIVNSIQLQAPACLPQYLDQLNPRTFTGLLCTIGRKRSPFMSSTCIYKSDYIGSKKKNWLGTGKKRSICVHGTLNLILSKYFF